MLHDLDLTLNDGTATFVDLNMQYGGPTLYSEYGKFLFKQQTYLRNQEVTNLFGINQTTMCTLSLTNITGVISVHSTLNTANNGHLKILTTNNTYST